MPLLLPFPRQREPESSARLDLENPLVAGIRGWSLPSFFKGTETLTGTKLQPTANCGLMRGYYSTLGVGTTDKLDTGIKGTNTTGLTWLIIASQLSGGGSGAGRIITQNDQHLWTAIGSSNLSFSLSGGSPYWTPPALTATPSVNVITYAGGSADPKMWRDGVPQTVTYASGTRSGTIINVNSNYLLGNRGAGDRGHDGLLGFFAAWDRVLSDSEAAAVSKNPWSLLAADDIWVWSPSAAGGTTNATIAGTDGADSAVIAAANWTTAQIAATDGVDVANIAATVTTGAGITGTDGADNAVIAAANWTTAQIAATDGPDLSSVLADASGTTLATIAAADGADAASIYAANWTTATLAAIDAGDTVAVAGRVTTGAAIAGTDGADSAIIVAGGVGTTTAGISATDGADIAALTATGPIVLGIGGTIRQQSSRPRRPSASRSNIQRSTR